MKAITYNRYERAGIIFLVLLSILAQVIPSLLPRKNLSLIPSELLVQLTDSIKVKEVNSFNTITTPVKAEYFFFDPNAISKGGWIKLGVREKIAGNIIKYREKGGKFREADWRQRGKMI